MSTLKERIRIAFTKAQLRTNGITQKALAEACGVTPPSVNQWFSGKTLVIDMDNAKKAAEYLGCDPVWLANGEGNLPKLMPDENDMYFASPHQHANNTDKFRVWDAHYRSQRLTPSQKAKELNVDDGELNSLVEKARDGWKNTNHDKIAAIAKEPYKGVRSDLFKQKELLSFNLAPLKNAIPFLNDDEKEEFFNVLKLALCESDGKTYLDYLYIIHHHIESALAREYQEAEEIRLVELREKLQLKSNKAKNE